MLSKEDRKAYKEVLDVLAHTRKEDVEKIPSNFLEYLRKNALASYQPDFDYSMRIEDLKLSAKATAILAVIYQKYWKHS